MTLAPSAADLAEECPLAEAEQTLLADQAHELWLQLLPQLQNGRGQCAFLMQPLCLPQAQDLPVGERIHLGSEELQGAGLQGQRAGQLLPHHLCDLVEVFLSGPHLLPGLIQQLDAHTEELMEALVLAKEHG